MNSYEITQKILSVGPTYHVRRAGSEAILRSVRGKVLAVAPHLTMFDGEEGAEVATMRGNWLKTVFTITESEGNGAGVLTFPLFAFKKSFELEIRGETYRAGGSILAWSFTCHGPGGSPAFSIDKKLALRDKFRVEIAETMPENAALLAAIAIDQRFFQQNG